MKVKPLLQKINTSTFIEDLLTAYGVKDVGGYLSPTPDLFESPWDYPNMEMAVYLLHEAIENDWKIGVLVDSDTDGLMSAGIIVHFLSTLNINTTNIFHTGKEHGLSNDVFDEIKSNNFDLLIIPDASSNDTKRCKELSESGTKIIILDHHPIFRENPYGIVVNPYLSPNLNHNISGTGVTEKFVKLYCDITNEYCPNYLDMVAVSIISDICDMTAIENRTYFDCGLGIDHPIDPDKKMVSNPLLDLMFEELAKCSYTPKDVGWSIAPKINALCRVGTQEQKEIFFNGLVGQGDSKEALKVAKKAHGVQTRLVKKIVDEIEPTLDLSHNVIITYVDEDVKNYSGLVANKLNGQYNKTALVLRENNGKTWSGSVRSPFKIATLINESGLAKCQGHESAFGILLNKNKVDDLIEWFDEQEFDNDAQVTTILTPRQATIKLARLCESHSHLWASGVPNPTFYMTGAVTGSKVNVYRKKTNTAKLNIDGVDFIKFRCSDEEADMFEQIKKAEIEMIVTLSINEFRGNVSVQGMIEEYKILPVKSKKIEAQSWEELF